MRASQGIRIFFLLLTLCTCLLSVPASAASQDSELAARLAGVFQQKAQLPHELRMERISKAEYDRSLQNVYAEERQLREQLGRLPRATRRAVEDEAKSLWREQRDKLQPAWDREYGDFYLAGKEAEAEARLDAARTGPNAQQDAQLAEQIVELSKSRAILDHELAMGRIGRDEHKAQSAVIHDAARELNAERTRFDFARNVVLKERIAAREEEILKPLLAKQGAALDAKRAAEAATKERERQKQLAEAARHAEQAAEARAAQAAGERAKWTAIKGIYFIVLIASLIIIIVEFKSETSSQVLLDREDKWVVRSGRTLHRLYSSTGTVLSPSKQREVRTHISGGGSTYNSATGGYQTAPISSSTTTILHLEFFIREADGHERPMQFRNVDMALREGQLASALWGIKDGEDRGHYFMLYNHSTGEIEWFENRLLSLVGVRCQMGTALSLVGMLLPLIVLLPAIKRANASRINELKREIEAKLFPLLQEEATKFKSV
jgi:hypothetical protein